MTDELDKLNLQSLWVSIGQLLKGMIKQLLSIVLTKISSIGVILNFILVKCLGHIQLNKNFVGEVHVSFLLTVLVA